MNILLGTKWIMLHNLSKQCIRPIKKEVDLTQTRDCDMCLNYVWPLEILLRCRGVPGNLLFWIVHKIVYNLST